MLKGTHIWFLSEIMADLIIRKSGYMNDLSNRKSCLFHSLSSEALFRFSCQYAFSYPFCIIFSNPFIHSFSEHIASLKWICYCSLFIPLSSTLEIERDISSHRLKIRIFPIHRFRFSPSSNRSIGPDDCSKPNNHAAWFLNSIR